MKNIKKIYILSLILIFLPISGQASSNLTEIKSELYTASIALTGLSSDPTLRQSQLSLINLELKRLSINLNSLLQGRVLGVSTSNTSLPASNGSKRPLAEVEVSPGNRSSNRVVFGGGHRDVFSFVVEPSFSDIWMQQVEIVFDREVWRYIDEISLVSGNKVLYKLEDLEDDDFSEIGDEDAYAIRLSGFNEKIKEGLKKSYKIRITAKDARGYDGIDVKVYMRKGAVRFIDEVDFAQRVPYQSDDERGRLSSEFEIVAK